ncbi:MAG: hypothetical protein N2561_06100 [Bacteroidetes bacterium]|nr:hypothetical protein [Rhodothermia bacterium]MCX7907092.1 hypothetical protein [Bacteroidota bacterium]MDW8285502.1 hypothetical protein [Bacteroidota bacterium]
MKQFLGVLMLAGVLFVIGCGGQQQQTPAQEQVEPAPAPAPAPADTAAQDTTAQQPAQ